MLPYEDLAYFSAISGYLLQRLGEWRVSRANVEFLDFAGAETVASRWVTWFYAWEWAAALCFSVVYLFSHKPLTEVGALSGLSIMVLGVLLRRWAIRSLGRTWNMGCWYIPGVAPVKSGPYRALRHPEFLGRLLEMLGLAVFLQQGLIGAAFFAGFMILGKNMARLEEAQLQSCAGEMSLP